MERFTDGIKTIELEVLRKGVDVTRDVIDYGAYDEKKDALLLDHPVDKLLKALSTMEEFTVTTKDITPTVRDLTNRYGISQAALGRRFGIPLRTIQNWCAAPGSNAHKPCPPYVLGMMEELLAADAKNK